MAPSWSELPPELLGVVFLHLRCLADRAYFAAACRSWRSAAARASAPTPPPPQLPWLLLVPSAGAPCFVSLLAGSARRRISLPHGAHGARLCGAHTGGWLGVAANGWRAYALVNAFSRAWVPLPDRMRVPGHGITTCLVVRAVALSAPPTSQGCIAAALVCGVSNLAFVRPGTDRQWLASGSGHGLQDILYHDGEAVRGFHAVANDEAVTVFVQEGLQGAPALRMAWRSYRMQRRRNAPGPRQSPSAGVSRYLVESRGKLLMVVRRFPSVQHGGGAATSRGFEVLELEVQALPSGDHAASWVELDGGLDGRVLFLARGCSRAFEASQFGGFQEGIYFLDDTRFDISLALSCGGNFPCSDIGWYSGSEIMPGIKGFPSEFQSTFSSPTWFYP
ncbi:hypothetical protein PAHAL_5G218800 [Panicum hallii]|jgi:hypothetical protein|uniref:KIB1-4 beta-propeller domain-containing protein n=1 Tax=Panicum hallii TaxID=206008 RepID=A0A2S3HTA4_9POAL|nr:uncharacterized protein LOC112894200 [Panicum hallii]PAN29351.1 hypothetical protein PAHAL_5G218800 [Panicum hallii]